MQHSWCLISLYRRVNDPQLHRPWAQGRTPCPDVYLSAAVQGGSFLCHRAWGRTAVCSPQLLLRWVVTVPITARNLIYSLHLSWSQMPIPKALPHGCLFLCSVYMVCKTSGTIWSIIRYLTTEPDIRQKISSINCFDYISKMLPIPMAKGRGSYL